MKRLDKVSKQSMEYGGKDVNHSWDGPFRVVGKALHMLTSSLVYEPKWVTYILTCSSGFVSPQ